MRLQPLRSSGPRLHAGASPEVRRTARTDATGGVSMRERRPDDPSVRRWGPSAARDRRPVISHHPGASRRASHRLTPRADRTVTVAAAVVFSAVVATGAELVSDTIAVPSSPDRDGGVSSWPLIGAA